MMDVATSDESQRTNGACDFNKFGYYELDQCSSFGTQAHSDPIGATGPDVPPRKVHDGGGLLEEDLEPNESVHTFRIKEYKKRTNRSRRYSNSDGISFASCIPSLSMSVSAGPQSAGCGITNVHVVHSRINVSSPFGVVSPNQARALRRAHRTVSSCDRPRPPDIDKKTHQATRCFM